jgi:hypothetical protein
MFSVNLQYAVAFNPFICIYKYNIAEVSKYLINECVICEVRFPMHLILPQMSLVTVLFPHRAFYNTSTYKTFLCCTLYKLTQQEMSAATKRRFVRISFFKLSCYTNVFKQNSIYGNLSHVYSKLISLISFAQFYICSI